MVSLHLDGLALGPGAFDQLFVILRAEVFLKQDGYLGVK